MAKQTAQKIAKKAFIEELKRSGLPIVIEPKPKLRIDRETRHKQTLEKIKKWEEIAAKKPTRQNVK